MFALDRCVAAAEKESPNVARIDGSAVSTYCVTVSPPASTLLSKTYISRVLRDSFFTHRDFPFAFFLFIVSDSTSLPGQPRQNRLKRKSGTWIFIEVSSDNFLVTCIRRQTRGGGEKGEAKRGIRVCRGKLRGTGRRKNGHGSRTRGNLIDHRQSSRGPRKNSRILQHILRPSLPATPRLRAR